MERKTLDLVSPVHANLGDEVVYEDPENVISGRKGQFELTACPAYESSSNDQPQVQTTHIPTVDQGQYDN